MQPSVTSSLRYTFCTFEARQGLPVRPMVGNALAEHTDNAWLCHPRCDWRKLADRPAPALRETRRQGNAVGWQAMRTVADFYGLRDRVKWPSLRHMEGGRAVSDRQFDRALKTLQKEIAILEGPAFPNTKSKAELQYRETYSWEGRARELYVLITTETVFSSTRIPFVGRVKSSTSKDLRLVPIVATRRQGSTTTNELAAFGQTFATRGQPRLERRSTASFVGR